MTAAFMLYATLVAVFVGAAALLTEKALGALGWATRGAWMLAMLLSVALPVVFQVAASRPNPTVTVPHQPPAIVQPAESAPRLLSTSVSTQVAVSASPRMEWPSLPTLDSGLRILWGALSASLALFYLYAWLLLRRSARAWPVVETDGTRTLLSESVGPAVIGFWKPKIVIPRWLLNAHASTRALALRHESQHIASRDPLVQLFGLAVVVLAPWNVGLWWQLRRLRFSIELDCDARVLRTGAEVSSYGQVLLAVGRYQSAVPIGAVALTESASNLEKRITAMMRGRPRHAALIAVACIASALSLLAAAAQVNTPRSQDHLVLPPPQPGFLPKVQGVVRAKFPELFNSQQKEPVLLNLLLNNDFTVDVAEKRTFPVGTSLDVASPPGAANSGFDSAVLHPADPRWGGREVLGGKPGRQVFLNFAVRGVSKSRSAAIVEPAVKAQFPHLYDAEPDGRVLVTAFFNEDGTVRQAVAAPYANDEILLRRDDQLTQLAVLGVERSEVGTISAMPGSQLQPYRPTVLYGFVKSRDPAVDSHPLSPDSAADVIAQQALVERYFPDALSQGAHAHELLWVLLEGSGKVMHTGRAKSDPDGLTDTIRSLVPGANILSRRTKQVGDLFGSQVLDDQGPPLIVTFIWTEPAVVGALPDVLVKSSIYRDGTLVSSDPISLPFGQIVAQEIIDTRNATQELSDTLNLGISATSVSEEEVELRLRIQARAQRNGIEYADARETAAEPVVRVKYGAESVVELGVQYPGSSTATIWRFELTPKRAAATSP